MFSIKGTQHIQSARSLSRNLPALSGVFTVPVTQAQRAHDVRRNGAHVRRSSTSNAMRAMTFVKQRQFGRSDSFNSPSTTHALELKRNVQQTVKCMFWCGRQPARYASTSAQSLKPTPPPGRLLQPMSFPHKKLMGPGPSNCPPRVLNAGSLPMLGHLHPEFTQIMDDVKTGIKYAFQTDNTWTVCVSGSGHAAMETAACNLIEDGDKVLSCVNGLWGERFADMASRHGASVSTLNKPMGTIFTLQDIEKGLKEHSPQVLFITHGESSGATVQNLEGIGALCHRHGCLLIVDSVAAMGGVPLFMDKWEIDVVYTGAQKVLSAPPGVSPISFSERARSKVESRKTKIRSYYFDMHHLANYWGCDDQARRYHHTGLISSVYALREGLSRLAEVGLEQSWLDHASCAQMLHEGLEKTGLELLVKDKSARLPCVTAIVVPENVPWKAVADHAMNNHRVEISGGLGAQAGKIWRIGLMGYNCTPENVKLVLMALQEALNSVK